MEDKGEIYQKRYRSSTKGRLKIAEIDKKRNSSRKRITIVFAKDNKNVYFSLLNAKKTFSFNEVVILAIKEWLLRNIH